MDFIKESISDFYSMYFLRMNIIDFIRMNISAGLIITAMILIRKFAIRKLNYSVILAVWVMAVIRLTIPFNITSELSIYNIYCKIKLAFFNNNYDIDYTVNNAFFYIWLIGFIFLSIFFILVFYNSCIRIKKAVFLDSDYICNFIKKHNLKRNVTVKISNEITSPASFGIIKPVVLFPVDYDFDNREQLSHILTHEILHIKYFHFIIELLFSFLLCIFWFNPFIWLLRVFIEKDLEILCDKKAIAFLGNKKKYADSLVNCSQKLNCNKNNYIYNHFIKNSLEERIYAIMNLKKASVFSTIVSLIIVGGIFSVFATDDCHIFGDEIYTRGKIISIEPNGSYIPETVFSDEIPEIKLYYSDLKKYIIREQTDRTKYSIYVTNYEYVRYGSISPSINVSVQKNGYNYIGMLTLGPYTTIDAYNSTGDYDKPNSKYIGHYSGTLYRQLDSEN